MHPAVNCVRVRVRVRAGTNARLADATIQTAILQIPRSRACVRKCVRARRTNATQICRSNRYDPSGDTCACVRVRKNAHAMDGFNAGSIRDRACVRACALMNAS
jgi:hypothetical protein